MSSSAKPVAEKSKIKTNPLPPHKPLAPALRSLLSQRQEGGAENIEMVKQVPLEKSTVELLQS